MNELARASTGQEEGRGLQTPNPRAVLVVEKSEWDDALRMQEGRQKKRRWIGLGTAVAGALAMTLGLLGDPVAFPVAIGLFCVPFFGAGWYLLAGTEIRRLKGEIERLEGELQALDEEERRMG